MNQRFKFSSVKDEKAFIKDGRRYLSNSAENSTCILDFGFLFDTVMVCFGFPIRKNKKRFCLTDPITSIVSTLLNSILVVSSPAAISISFHPSLYFAVLTSPTCTVFITVSILVTTSVRVAFFSSRIFIPASRTLLYRSALYSSSSPFSSFSCLASSAYSPAVVLNATALELSAVRLFSCLSSSFLCLCTVLYDAYSKIARRTSKHTNILSNVIFIGVRFDVSRCSYRMRRAPMRNPFRR